MVVPTKILPSGANAVPTIFLGWVAAVGIVIGLVTRPWKSAAARAPLPLALALTMAVWVLSTGVMTYNELITKGSWTAATVAIPLVPIKAIVFALLAYAMGRTFLTARATKGPTAQRWGAPAGLAVLCLYFVVSDARTQYEMP